MSLTETEFHIKRLCIIGVGLIGGSLARALREAGAVDEIVGSGRQVESLQTGCDLGVIDRFETDPAQAVVGADMVVIAVPIGAMEPVLTRIAPVLDEQSVLTDVGSVKGEVVGIVRQVFGHTPARFVPGHPIAGTERSGVEASFATLFRNRRVILTPLVETDVDAHHRVRAMWQAAGAEVIDTGVRHHDEVLAATSHLPHLLAYCLVDTLARLDDRAEIFKFAAGGFRDFTRIASSDPKMWHDICLSNRDQLLALTELFSRDLAQLAEAVKAGDSEAIMKVFQRAKHARDNLYLD